MDFRSVITWNAMIAAYAQYRHLTEAKLLFDTAPERNVITWTALVSSYTQSGCVQEAGHLLERMPQRDIVTWNALLAAHTQRGRVGEAEALFTQMPGKNTVTFNEMLVALAKENRVTETKSLFDRIPNPDTVSWTTMLAAYSHAGEIMEAASLFERIPQKNVVAWTTMFGAYARNGKTEEALEVYHRMDLEGTRPDEVSFLDILTACGHLGLVDLSRHCFVSLYDCGILPLSEHYMCIVDALSRAGKLREAQELLWNMPFVPHVEAWTTLLGACRVHGDAYLGARISEIVFQLDPSAVRGGAPYMLLLGMHAEASSQTIYKQRSR